MKAITLSIDKRILIAAAILLAAVLCRPAWSAVEQPCHDCHTMHNSQDGASMAQDGVSGPYAHLLMGHCVGCHTGTNDGTNAIPYVDSASEPTYGTNTLAGGSFYWVRESGGNDDAKGHNVFLGEPDDDLSEAPGKHTGCGGDSCHANLSVVQSMVGGVGSHCEGCHMVPAHHTPSVGTVTAAPWYRWLSGHMAGAGKGVSGIEDADWQYTKSATDHNEYLGISGTKTGTGGLAALGNTMSGYCTGCHGNFHIEQDGSSNWTRHPSDAVIPDSGEYASAFGGTYDPDVPVARVSLAGGVTGVVTAGSDMVMCLSCHRAHGTPYEDMLRWDYQNAGYATANAGCVKCHTEK